MEVSMKVFKNLFFLASFCCLAAHGCCAMQNNQNDFEEQLKEYKKRIQERHAKQLRDRELSQCQSYLQPNAPVVQNAAKQRRKILTSPCNGIILSASQSLPNNDNQELKAKSASKHKKKANNNKQKSSFKRKIDQMDQDQEMSDISVQDYTKKQKFEEDEEMDLSE